MRVFLSYHGADRALAESVRDRLVGVDPGFEIFFAPYSINVGAFWLPQLSDAIAQAEAFVLVLGSRLGEWQKLEYYEALNKFLERQSSRDASFPLISVVTVDSPPNLPFLQQIQNVQGRPPLTDGAIASIARALRGEAVEEQKPPWRTVNPYRGLAALEEQDAEFFFGRESETREIIDAIAENSREALMLVGNSGVGKSSLVQAGVIGTLKRQLTPHEMRWPEHWPQSRRWAYIVMRPGDRPVMALAAAFTRLWRDDPAGEGYAERLARWEERLATSASISDLLDDAARANEARGLPVPERVLLYVDQGEELYALSDRNQAGRCSELLADGLADPRLTVVGSQRADYYGRLQENAALWRKTRVFDVPPLSAEALETVLRRPAQILGAGFEDQMLPMDLATAAAAQPGALPLLADHMSELWESMQQRGDGLIRMSRRGDLVEIGAALSRRAERFLSRYPEWRDDVKRLFTLRLATVPRRGEPVRRWLAKERCTVAEWQIIEELAAPQWRLVSIVDEDGAPTASLAHEVLLRQWPRLTGWIETERDFLGWHEDTSSQAELWASAPSYLRRSILLTGYLRRQAQRWAKRRRADMSSLTLGFVQESARSHFLFSLSLAVAAVVVPLFYYIISNDVSLAGWPRVLSLPTAIGLLFLTVLSAAYLGFHYLRTAVFELGVLLYGSHVDSAELRDDASSESLYSRIWKREESILTAVPWMLVLFVITQLDHVPSVSREAAWLAAPIAAWAGWRLGGAGLIAVAVGAAPLLYSYSNSFGELFIRHSSSFGLYILSISLAFLFGLERHLRDCLVSNAILIRQMLFIAIGLSVAISSPNISGFQFYVETDKYVFFLLVIVGLSSAGLSRIFLMVAGAFLLSSVATRYSVGNVVSAFGSVSFEFSQPFEILEAAAALLVGRAIRLQILDSPRNGVWDRLAGMLKHPAALAPLALLALSGSYCALDIVEESDFSSRSFYWMTSIAVGPYPLAFLCGFVMSIWILAVFALLVLTAGAVLPAASLFGLYPAALPEPGAPIIFHDLGNLLFQLVIFDPEFGRGVGFLAFCLLGVVTARRLGAETAGSGRTGLDIGELRAAVLRVRGSHTPPQLRFEFFDYFAIGAVLIGLALVGYQLALSGAWPPPIMLDSGLAIR